MHANFDKKALSFGAYLIKCAESGLILKGIADSVFAVNIK
jgi:hypothetical protein